MPARIDDKPGCRRHDETAESGPCPAFFCAPARPVPPSSGAHSNSREFDARRSTRPPVAKPPPCRAEQLRVLLPCGSPMTRPPGIVSRAHGERHVNRRPPCARSLRPSRRPATIDLFADRPVSGSRLCPRFAPAITAPATAQDRGASGRASPARCIWTSTSSPSATSPTSSRCSTATTSFGAHESYRNSEQFAWIMTGPNLPPPCDRGELTERCPGSVRRSLAGCAWFAVSLRQASSRASGVRDQRPAPNAVATARLRWDLPPRLQPDATRSIRRDGRLDDRAAIASMSPGC